MVVENFWRPWRRSSFKMFHVLIAFIMSAILLFGTAPTLVKADSVPKLELQTEVGFGKSMKSSRLNPVKFTLTSQDADLSGDLVIQLSNPNGGKDISYIQHVELPQGVSKEVWFALPGTGYTEDSNLIRFYRDSIDKGKVIPFAGGNDYLNIISVQSAFVGVISDDTDAFNFLSLLQQNISLELVPLKADKLPGETMMYDSLDILAINQFPSDTLTAEQVQAITEWVGNGGTLILSGGAGIGKTARAFESLLPVQVQGTTTVSDLSAMADAVGKPFDIVNPVTLSAAKLLPDSEVLLSQDDVPLFVSKNYGSGRVIYAAYDPALQPFSSWNGQSALWGELLQQELSYYDQQTGGFRQDRYWVMKDALDYFPSIHSPAFGLLVMLLIAYAIIVAPVLYLILKKFDRREWAWFIIPSLAIVSSIVIYVVGAADKTKILGHTLTIVELNQEGQGKRSGGSAIFVPTGGNYKLTFDRQVLPQQLDDSHGYQRELAGESEVYFRFRSDQNEVEFKKIPYWSVRKTMLREMDSIQAGQISGEIGLGESGSLEGKITNNTISDLKNAFIYYNGQLQNIGDLKKSETKTFTIPINQTMRSSYYDDLGYMVYPYSGRNDNLERERQLLSYYSSLHSDEIEEKPIFFAWSENEGMDFQVNGKAIQNDQLTLWTQQLNLNLVQGNQIQIPFGYIRPKMAEENLQSYHYDIRSQVYSISGGSMVAEYQLPDIKNAHYSRLTIANISQEFTAELWNAEKQDWEQVDLVTPLVLDRAALNPYLDNNKIQIRLSISGGSELRLPDISLVGEVTS